eukprot:CAMPEP_0177677978 /NCGR_PEP_ID=MMETSP0447-20121125/28736_1 /TAXON_ID=0 /ORGANISM="Stygamoeba regulata, Strain BSH-02190019" /LENGTH=395 /DNA_ID=CAMNT_0019186895 /DNA_START=820 /DNA_END=2007 /DNA_ORIENTATION=-
MTSPSPDHSAGVPQFLHPSTPTSPYFSGSADRSTYLGSALLSVLKNMTPLAAAATTSAFSTASGASSCMSPSPYLVTPLSADEQSRAQHVSSLDALSPPSTGSPYYAGAPSPLEHTEYHAVHTQQLPHFHDTAPLPRGGVVPVGWSQAQPVALRAQPQSPEAQHHVRRRSPSPQGVLVCRAPPSPSTSQRHPVPTLEAEDESTTTTDSYRATNLRRIKKILTNAQVPKLPSARAMRELFPIKDPERVVYIYLHALYVRQMDSSGQMRSPGSTSNRRQRPSRLNPDRPLTATEIKSARIEYLRNEEEAEKQARTAKQNARTVLAGDVVHLSPHQLQPHMQPHLEAGSALQLATLAQQQGAADAESALSLQSFSLLPAVSDPTPEDATRWLRPSMFF